MSRLTSAKCKESITYVPELKRLRLFWGINVFLLVALFVMPQYFGIHIGYDITCTRFADVVIILYWFLSYEVFHLFCKSLLRCKAVVFPLLFYLFVALYTMVLRADINAFLLPFLEVITFFMLVYAIRYVIGVKNAIRIVNGCALFLSIYGLIEFVAGRSLYLQFLRTVPTAVANCYRSGFYRIMGPCGHPLGYGLLLILLIAIASIDLERDRVNFLQNPILILLLYINVFLTGSRSSLGISIVEGIIIIVLSDKRSRTKTIYYLIIFTLAFIVFLLVSYKTRIGRYLLMQITMLIDQVMGTTYAENFGASVITLQNSEEYRKYLPKIFTLDWLDPIVGRGIKRGFGAEFPTSDGGTIYIISIDNYYVMQYIKYAYPGLISYALFVLSSFVTMLLNAIKYKSGIMKMVLVGVTCYFFNLWWLDALQTLKFVYAILAIFFAFMLSIKDQEKVELRRMSELQ